MLSAKMWSETAFVLVFSLVYSQAAPYEFELEGRIVNGTDADIRNYPYMVSLLFNGRHTCGGSIIDEYNILTAAHCVTRDINNFTVLYGATTLAENHYSIPLERIIIHELYTGRIPLLHDVAVLHLIHELPLRADVRPIELPPPFSSTPELRPAILTGWGLNATGGSVQNNLQRVDIQIYSDEECEFRHRESGPTSRSWHICAGVQEGGRGQCNGDSGGPLVVDGVEVGIVSWSVKPCTVQGYPGVFVKVSSYVDWIQTHLKRV